jgi:hypothetical protein
LKKRIYRNLIITIDIIALVLVCFVLLIPAVQQNILYLFINYPQPIIAVAAVIVSIFSILIARESLNMQRKHNTLSVKPIPNISEGDYVDTGKVEVLLENVGAGSMVIQKMKTFNKKGESKVNLFDWIDDEVKPFLNDHTTKLEENTLKVGNKYDLLSYKYDPTNDESWKRSFQIRKTLKDLIVQVEYADIYGNIQPEFVYPLNWFEKSIHREKDFKNIVKSYENILIDEWEF